MYPQEFRYLCASFGRKDIARPTEKEEKLGLTSCSCQRERFVRDKVMIKATELGGKSELKKGRFFLLA